MLLSALDPALLIYQQGHWQSRQSHVFRRMRALSLHRRTIRRHNQQIALSNDIAAQVQQCFPWNQNYKSIGELRDLRQFILEEFSRAHFISGTKSTDDISLQPSDLTCAYVNDATVLDAWKDLLNACLEGEVNSEYDVQVATWESPGVLANQESVAVSITRGAAAEDHHLPLVWNEDSWARQLYAQDSWPDLKRCVEFYFRANVGMQRYSQVRSVPIPFDCTASFWKSVDQLCHPRMRRLLVKAIAKKVYGVLDSKLGDEPFGQVRRFRVTGFWRVHYRQCKSGIVLERFGEHDMGI